MSTICQGREPLAGLAVFVFIAAVGCGEGNVAPAAPTPAPVQSAFTLSGTVTESAPTTDTPIPGATITILDGPHQGQTTTGGGSGAFQFTGLTQAGFNIRASAPGYEDSLLGINLAGDTSAPVHLRPVYREIWGTFSGHIRLDDRERCDSNGSSVACRRYPMDVHHDGHVLLAPAGLSKTGVLHLEVWQDENRLDTTNRNLAGSGAIKPAVKGGFRYEARVLYVAGPSVENDFRVVVSRPN